MMIARKIEKRDGLLNFSDLKMKRYKFLYTIMFLILLTISMTCLLPILWVFLSGFKTTEEMYAIPPTILPKSFDLSNLIRVMSKVNFGKYLKNTIIIIAGCWACDIGINGLAGYVLSRVRPIGSRTLNTLIFWSMLLPGISMVTLYMTFVKLPILHLNLLGTFIPLYMMAGAGAFNVLMFKNYFDGIPMSYIEAARIDGCSNLFVFFRIIMPLSKPIIMALSIFNIIGNWGSFMWPYLIVGNTDKEPLSVALYQIGQNGRLLQNEYMLMMFIAIVPMLVVFCIFSKRITGGMSMSGIKG